jgi:hypothetical protein
MFLLTGRADLSAEAPGATAEATPVAKAGRARDLSRVRLTMTDNRGVCSRRRLVGS